MSRNFGKKIRRYRRTSAPEKRPPTSPAALRQRRRREPYKAPSRETDQGQEAVEAQGAVGTVLAMVEKSALVQVPDRAGAVPAARTAVVEDFDLRQVVDEPARLAGAATQVGILEVHKKALVQGPDLLQNPAPDGHARSGDPIHPRRAGELLRGGEETPDYPALREKPGQQGGPAQDAGDEGQLLAGRELGASVGSHQPRA